MKKIKSFHKTPISVFLILLLFSGCDSWKTDLKADIDQESKDYCLFAPGSYWIYQDSATLEIDSTVVVSVSYDKSTHANPKISFLWEEYIIKLKYFLEDNIYYEGCHVLTSKDCDDNKVEAGIIKPIVLWNERGIEEKYTNVKSELPIYHNGDIDELFRGLQYKNFYKNYSLEKNIYSNVRIFSCISYSYLYQINIYWAKHVGIIRTEYIGEDFYAVRNLIKYDVNPYN